jgi:hypothetical protein
VRPNADHDEAIAAVSVRKERRKKDVEMEVAEPRGKVCSTLAALPEIEEREGGRVRGGQLAMRRE